MCEWISLALFTWQVAHRYRMAYRAMLSYTVANAQAHPHIGWCVFYWAFIEPLKTIQYKCLCCFDGLEKRLLESKKLTINYKLSTIVDGFKSHLCVNTRYSVVKLWAYCLCTDVWLGACFVQWKWFSKLTRLILRRFVENAIEHFPKLNHNIVYYILCEHRHNGWKSIQERTHTTLVAFIFI